MTAAAWFAAGTAAAAVLLLVRPADGPPRWRRPPVPVMILLLGLAVLAEGRVPPALAVLGAVVAAAGVREVRRRRTEIVVRRRGDAVLALCEELCADLEAGQAPVSALTAAAAAWPEFGPVAEAARWGSDVPAAMRAVAERPGAGELRLVAAAWVIAHRSGAGLASAVDLAARTIRDDRAAARVVATELAAAHATARLLAVLPVGVLLIGRGAGGDPIGFLLATTPGLVCLCVGLALSWAGLVWMQRIADSVGRG